MYDLLPELRSKGKAKGYIFNETSLKSENTRVNMELQTFIYNNKLVQDQVKEIRTNNSKLRKAKEALVMCVSQEEKKFKNKSIQEITEKNSKLQSVIKNRLDISYNTFIKDIASNVNIFEQERRICRNLHGSSVKNFQEAILEFQSLESELKSLNEGMIIRQAEIYLGGKKLTADEKISYLEHPEQVQELVQKALQGQAPMKLQNALNDLEDRHSEIRKLEKSILEVHKLVQELSGLVKYQGEIVDNICDNIATARDDTLKAEENIIKSKENLSSARKKKCCILVIVIIIVIIVLLPVIILIF